VTTNDGSRSREIRVPCSAPIAVVTASAAAMAAHHGQFRGHHAAQPGHEADGQVDVAEQQREHLAHAEQHEHRALDEQVGQVHRGQEVAVQRLEDGPDDGQADDHGQRAALARREVGAEAAPRDGRRAADRAGGAADIHSGHRVTPGSRRGGRRRAARPRTTGTPARTRP
jgi:hypothetical protein